ncbi:hypothetical protein M422DRAFT_254223 [Sphaerobolus stellatus SS14]|uniref:F-box domain-containing protein n=1 Tax=Sphaerobolus stellatus (strain SS14) TaxID=990650 RepID=A0A0C9VLV3_SPHS4|nr:hypothetical protein M422DRAFT_254223 [Sphaerobolus stellatus SS14]
MDVLPIELQHEIFQLCLPPLFEEPEDLTSGNFHFLCCRQIFLDRCPFTFGAARIRAGLRLVCKGWNDIVVECPTIWNQLEIDASRFLLNPRRLYNLVEYSKAAKLDWQLYLGRAAVLYDNEEQDSAQIQAVMNIVRNQFPRIRSLSLFLGRRREDVYLKHLFPIAIPNEMPQLQYLSINSGGYRPIRETGPIVAPKLVTCDLHFRREGWWEVLTPLTLSKLAHLCLNFEGDLLKDEVEYLLSNCGNLQTLSLDGVVVSVSLIFPTLKSLSIHTKEHDDIAAFQHLDAPWLQSLTLEDCCETDSSRLLISRYRSLRELRLVKVNEQVDLFSLLAPLHFLHTLIISDSEVSNASLRPLILPQVPRMDTLKTLIIEKSPIGWTPSKTFLYMVRRHLEEAIFPPLVFNIWTDGHKFSSDNSSRVDQVGANHRVLLDLSNDYPERVRITKWEPIWRERSLTGRVSALKRKQRLATE